MEKVNELILDAIETFVDKKVKDAPYDYTQIGTIVEPLGGGNYIVSANGEEFEVESPYIGLQKLDKVYVITRLNNKHKRYISGTFGERILMDTGISTITLTQSEVDDLINVFNF